MYIHEIILIHSRSFVWRQTTKRLPSFTFFDDSSDHPIYAPFIKDPHR